MNDCINLVDYFLEEKMEIYSLKISIFSYGEGRKMINNMFVKKPFV